MPWRGIYEDREFPQWFLFLVLAYLTLATYFALNMIPTEPLFNKWTYYVLLFIPGTVILGLSILFFGEPKDEKFCPDWDQNWKREHVVVYGVAVGLILGISFLTNGLISNYFPGTALPQSLMPVTFTLIPQSVSNISVQSLWQLFGVAGGEETLKVASIVGLTRAFKHKWLFVIGVIFVWAYAHSVVAYGTATAPIIAALLAGIVIYGAWEATGNYLVCVGIHFTVNILFLLPTFGLNIFNIASLLPTIGLIPFLL